MRKLIILKLAGILFLYINLAGAGELTIDGGFESGTTSHWNEWGLKEWSVVDSPVRSGSFAGKLFDVGTGYGYIQEKGIIISPGKLILLPSGSMTMTRMVKSQSEYTGILLTMVVEVLLKKRNPRLPLIVLPTRS